MTETQYTIETSRSSFRTLRVTHPDGRQTWLHSRYSPEQDCTLFADRRSEILGHTVIIVLGCGLGYHLQGLLGGSNYRGMVFVIDALPLTSAHMQPIPDFDPARMHLLCGMSADTAIRSISGMLDLDRQSRLIVLEHPASLRTFPEYYTAVHNGLKALIDRKISSMNTISHLGLPLLRNACINAARLHRYRTTECIRGMFSGSCFAVLSSGPSLDMIIPWLHEHQHTVITIAADSALPALAARHIEPDFYISIDPQVWVHEHCRVLPSRAIALTGINACHSVSHRQAILYTGSHPLAQLIDHAAPGRFTGIDSATGNVTGDALRAASFMGASSIILAGADFSFPAATTYARGTMYQNRYALFSLNRFNSAETQNMHYVHRSSRNFRHQGIATRRNFLDYQQSINNLLTTINCPVYHFTPAGIRLASAHYAASLHDLPQPLSAAKHRLFTKLSTLSPDINNRAICVHIQKMLENETVMHDLLAASGVPLSAHIAEKVRQWLVMGASCTRGAIQ